MIQHGVYFDGWFPHQHNYHPSLPARRLKMVDELVDMNATMLVWSALGGGSISLPYLEQEAYGDIPARFRMHGFVNDAEFIAACAGRGIEVFGVIFEAQGWEFPAEFSSDGRLLALNETRGAGARSWVGLREFTQGTGPADWKPLEHYFPDGLVNSRGERVVDLWDECTSRDLEGAPLRAHWVESTDREHVAHFMDRNNPVWRRYLSEIARIQIEAGVAGVQLDESETPFGAMGYGGCFCADCMLQFRDYLLALSAEDRPAELAGVDLGGFDYRRWLLDQGFTAGTSAMRLPLYRHFVRFNALAMKTHFRELAAEIRVHAARVGRTVKIAGNFYNGNPEYDALVDEIDVLVTEMHHTRYTQPWWFRHVEGLGRGRDVLVVENPYGGIVPELVADLARGRAYDRFRTSIYEGAAMGPSMTFPYGSWMGSEIEDAFWAPKPLLDECGAVLASVAALRSPRSLNEVAVLYPVADAVASDIAGPRWIRDDLRGTAEEPAARVIDYWPVLEALGGSGIPIDCIPLPDERERANDVTRDALAGFATVVVPGADRIGARQHAELLARVRSGGRVIVIGDYGGDLPGARAELVEEGAVEVTSTDDMVGLIDAQIIGDIAGLAFNTQLTVDGGVALHIVNYDYEPDADATVPRRDIELCVRVPAVAADATLHGDLLGGGSIPVRIVGDRLAVRIPTLGIYTVLAFA